jgi:DNA ligase-1
MFIMNVKKALLLFLLGLFNLPLHGSSLNRPEIQQGKTYQKDKNIDISLYYVSEKLDGMRGYWDGTQLYSRQGNIINTPQWFTQGWPNITIDGELWISRNTFQPLISCVRKKVPGSCWDKVRFMMFDLPNNNNSFSHRVADIKKIVGHVNSPDLQSIKQFRLNTLSELDKKLNQVINNKGEGLMLHLANAYYKVGRHDHLLKLKKHQDAEAIIIAHHGGKGKFRHMLGSIEVKTAEGVIFKIGSGFSDKERKNPPVIGTIITYKYNGLTQSGIPRFARYWRIRTDTPDN